MADLIKSRGPSAVPPVVITISIALFCELIAAEILLTSRSKSSVTKPLTITSAPKALSMAGNCGPRASRTKPSTGTPLCISSSPRKKIAMRGRRITTTSSWPAAANKPIFGAFNSVPALINSSPFLLSAPAGRMFAPSSLAP
ncbi:unannotated protein [freshwater metagenome]|uniref:Unannotated protein n=1 Tax=freshwater metagenome TaxID=449393 RepID=A0A6J7SEN0_9ZZZZ